MADPAGRRLPDAADGADPGRGRSVVPVRAARSGRGARPGNGGDRGAPEGAGRPAAGTACPGIAVGRALPPRRGGLVPGRRGGAASWRRWPTQSGRPAPIRIDYGRSDRSVARLLEPLGVVLKGGVWYVVARTRASPDVPGVADPRRGGTRRAASNSRPSRLRSRCLLGRIESPRTSARRHALRW